MGDYLQWAIVLIAIAFVLFFIEFFVPSAGLLPTLAVLCLAGGVFFLFKVSTTVGLIGAILCLASLPFVFMLGMKIFPTTAVFRALSLEASQKSSMGEHGIAGAEAVTKEAELIGKTGKAMTDLRPVGSCVIEGHRIDCTSSGPVIRAGKMVRVVAADGLQVKVTEVDE